MSSSVFVKGTKYFKQDGKLYASPHALLEHMVYRRGHLRLARARFNAIKKTECPLVIDGTRVCEIKELPRIIPLCKISEPAYVDRVMQGCLDKLFPTLEAQVAAAFEKQEAKGPDENVEVKAIAREIKGITRRIKRLHDQCDFSNNEEKERKLEIGLYKQFSDGDFDEEAIVVTGLVFGSSSSLAESLSVRYE